MADEENKDQETPAPEPPVSETPPAGTEAETSVPAAETPAAEAPDVPAAETPTADAPAAETPTAEPEAPAPEAPAADAPAAEAPAAPGDASQPPRTPRPLEQQGPIAASMAASIEARIRAEQRQAAAPRPAPGGPTRGGGGPGGGPGGPRGGRGGWTWGQQQDEKAEFVERVVHLNRVAKVVKGGRRFSFSALVVVGDQRGRVGAGLGKAGEVPEAIRKGVEDAKKNMTAVKMDGTTIPHEVRFKLGAAKVMLKPASPGTGVISGGAMRAVIELAGIKDILTKSLGTNNPINTTRATIAALKTLRTANEVAVARGVELRTLGRRFVESANGATEARTEEPEEGEAGVSPEVAVAVADAQSEAAGSAAPAEGASPEA